MKSENIINKSDNFDVATLIMEKLQRTETDFKDLFEKLDDFRKDSEFWDDKDYLPYSYIYKIIKRSKYYDKIYCCTPNGNIRSINKIASIVHALYTWRFSKKIYRFSNDLVDDLSKYNIYDMKVYTDFIEKLPFNGMCIYTDNKDIAYFDNSAIIVVLDTYDHMYKCLSFYVFNINRLEDEYKNSEIKDGIIEGCIDFTIPLINDKSIAECIEYFCSNHNVWKEYNISDYQSFVTQIFNLLLHILYANSNITVENSIKYYYKTYLAEICDEEECVEINGIIDDDVDKVIEEKEINESKPKVIDIILSNDIEMPNGDIDFSKITIRKRKHSISTDGRKRPHVRRGHWQNYWYGSNKNGGKKYCQKVWINTIFVNGYNENTESVSISSVI